MEAVDTFTIQTHRGRYEDRPLESRLYFHGQQLSFKVPGYVIEKQYDCGAYFLLILSWDCIFEEGCEVVVISKQLEKVGDCNLTPYYNSYILTSFSKLATDQYQLVFNDSEYYELTVHYPKKRWYCRVAKLVKSQRPIDKDGADHA
ncbi:conserved hypothetical protein [Vibrio nigripulchritudo MADA3029]|uniref:hypothetical protein n=1 Tax=Vibrio nigripulchritudo TaxID=28173 RepID=UPI0003B18E5C|nr:hypothetical protein [Vibrio nigripulchritudo]CCN49659.1 conserved hypothetical protein [Vibrio nigripulchritudo MADA3020]CCN52027.1 conserved hypothetical protein [Vibrio nigripulchritudo MADA3021]CCN59372.1 conserved hypothetical protein [Vibrio nigripulchritudo MADA3029]